MSVALITKSYARVEHLGVRVNNPGQSLLGRYMPICNSDRGSMLSWRPVGWVGYGGGSSRKIKRLCSRCESYLAELNALRDGFEGYPR